MSAPESFIKALSSARIHISELLNPEVAPDISDEDQGRNSNPRGPLVFGLTITVVLFGVLGVWAALAPLGSAISAAGTVVVESERKVVQHLEGGIIKDILVAEGDSVEKDDVLLVLDDTRPSALLEITKGQLFQGLALEARLLAERDQLEAIQFPQELLNSDEEAAIRAIEGQKRLFTARRDSYLGEIDILEQKIVQYEEGITGMQSQQVARQKQVKLFNKELVGLRKLGEQGNISQNYILERERDLARLEGEHGKYIADVARSRQGIGETRLQINQLKKDMQEQVVRELNMVQSSNADLKERYITAMDVLQRTNISAPASGTVIGLSFHTVGGVVSPGTTILQIVPQDDELIFECKVQTTDIDDVQIGQEATLRLSAFSFRHTAILEGEVIHAAADSLTDKATGKDFYTVRVKVPVEQLAKLGDAQLHPGMPVQVLIKTGESTPLGYILAPFRDAWATAFIEK